MIPKKVFTDKEIEYIKEQYKNPNISQTDIAKTLGVSPSTLNRFAREIGIKKIIKSVWTLEKEEWLKLNYSKPYSELVKYLGFSDDTIQKKLKNLGIKRQKISHYKVDPTDTQFWIDVDNPKMTAPEIVEKYFFYGISTASIHKYRKKRGIKLQINTRASESSSERFVREILDNLDIAYLKEKLINIYSIDFYLGFKACIEVQGGYWHGKEDRIVADKRKLATLDKLGYKVLYIYENDLENAEEKILNFIKILGFPIQ